MSRTPTPDEIRAAVALALAGTVSLETAVSRLVKGRDPDPNEPAWSQPERRVWLKAVDLYLKARQTPRDRVVGPKGGRPGAVRLPTLAEVWAQIERIAASNEREWWEIRRSWPLLGKALGLGDRRVAYLMAEVQGWRFGGRSANRHITHAPCLACETPHPMTEIVGRLCPTCRESPTGDTHPIDQNAP